MVIEIDFSRSSNLSSDRMKKNYESGEILKKNLNFEEFFEGVSRDLRFPSITIGKSSLIRSVCERPQDGYLLC